MTTIKLWFSAYTRATRPRWLLEELEVPYELVKLDMKAREHKAPAYVDNIHPHGAVPAAEINGRTIIESAAIVATIADLFPEKGLAPKPDAKDRPTYNMWLFYAQATIEPSLLDVMAARKADSTLTDDKKADAEKTWREVLGFVERGLGHKHWILGEHFSAADCIVGALLVWANSGKYLEGFPVAQAYADRCRSRPAFSKARN